MASRGELVQGLGVGTHVGSSSESAAGRAALAAGDLRVGVGFTGAGEVGHGEDSYNNARDVAISRDQDHFMGLYCQGAGASTLGRTGFVAYVGGEGTNPQESTAPAPAPAHGASNYNSDDQMPLIVQGIARSGVDHDQQEAAAADQRLAWPTSVAILSKDKLHARQVDHAGGHGINDPAYPNDNLTETMRGALEFSAHKSPEAFAQHLQHDDHQQLQQKCTEYHQLRQLRTGIMGMACRDCGNQAKKDCAYQRCRTCCKSRGFDCATHVKSTWVPAAKRKEMEQAEVEALMHGNARVVPKFKRARTLAAAVSAAAVAAAAAAHHHAASTTSCTSTTPRTSDFYSGQSLPQDAKFKAALPPEVKAKAVFKFVRVTSVNDGEDEYAYQAVVKIGGHIFKGMLYDQGLDKGDMPSSVAGIQVGGRSTASSSALIDFAGIYGTPGSAFFAALH